MALENHNDVGVGFKGDGRTRALDHAGNILHLILGAKRTAAFVIVKQIDRPLVLEAERSALRRFAEILGRVQSSNRWARSPMTMVPMRIEADGTAESRLNPKPDPRILSMFVTDGNLASALNASGGMLTPAICRLI